MPGFFTWPLTAKSLKPGLFSVPKPRNHSAPWRTMEGMLAIVSTLLTTVGLA